MNKALPTILLCAFLVGCAATRHDPGKGDTFDYLELTIAEVHQAMARHEISCTQLVAGYLDRIEAYDQPSRLNSVVYINPKALERARALDVKYATTERMRRLHCIPVILKDNFDTADMPTEAGSIALKGSRPPDDAFMVKRLRDADAIVIAKSNMGEWAFSPYDTVSSTHGETRNAYDLTRVPAGSSGGTASAIAANFGIIGMGTDTGNSIRGPASHLSLAGLRSTLGATSTDGIVPLLSNRDVGGPMTRSVEDLAIVYSVIAGFDPAGPLTQKARGHTRHDDRAYLKRDGLQGARLGVIREMFDTPSADPHILALMEAAIQDLHKAGATIVDPFVIPDFKSLTGATGFCSRFRFDLQHYLDSLGNPPPVPSLDYIVRHRMYLRRNADAMKWAMNMTGPPQQQTPPCIDVEGDPRRRALRDAVINAMDRAGIDAVVYPSWSNPPRLLGDRISAHGNNSPIIAPHTGQPAITVPMGFTPGGLPAGLQLLARPFDEPKLIQYAYAYEQLTRHRSAPKGFGKLGQNR